LWIDCLGNQITERQVWWQRTLLAIGPVAYYAVFFALRTPDTVESSVPSLAVFTFLPMIFSDLMPCAESAELREIVNDFADQVQLPHPQRVVSGFTHGTASGVHVHPEAQRHEVAHALLNHEQLRGGIPRNVLHRFAALAGLSGVIMGVWSALAPSREHLAFGTGFFVAILFLLAHLAGLGMRSGNQTVTSAFALINKFDPKLNLQQLPDETQVKS
jgi:hypothetical protein